MTRTLKLSALALGLGLFSIGVLTPALTQAQPTAAGPLAGLSFCFTGSASRPRGELTHEVESRGGRVLGSVTKELNYLVIADVESTSTKAAKARKLGTKLITEEQLFELIAEKEGAAKG